MNSHSTGSLAGSESDQAGNAYKVRTEGSRPTTVHIDNLGSPLVKIVVERED